METSSHCACLYTVSGDRVPLLGVDLRGEAFGAHARIVLRQRYKNEEAKPVEAIYVFPIPSEGSLVGFAMECAGRRMEAEVKEREEAFRAYDDAVTAGHGAALLDQERRNVFTASVGNLLPGEETVVEVVYVQALAADEGALRLTIPTLVAPRYIPGEASGDRSAAGVAAPTDRVPDADRITPAIGAVSYGLAVDVLFDLGRAVTVESPSHSIAVSEEGDKRRVKLTAKSAPLDRDLVLVASGAPGIAAGVVASKRSGEEGTFALTVVPDLFEATKTDERREVVFVIDVSGSMQGASIEQARSALKLCLRHLAEGDRFDIIAFQSSFLRFDADLVPFTQRTLAAADAFVDGLVANGGTEMLAPLLASLERRDPSVSRVVVLLTDGQVGNEAEIVARVVETAKPNNGAAARFYTFGIGTNVSDLLLNDLARRTRGAVETIYPGERIDEKVTAQFARALAARVEEVSVSFAGVEAGELAPSEIPDLVDGEPWVVYGRYAATGIGRAELRGKLHGERFLLEVPIDLPSEAEREGLEALWATARIRDLEAAETSTSGRRAASMKERIVALSTRHQVASKYASFVVVEKRSGDRRAQGQPETRVVPVNAPHGWGGGPQLNQTRGGMMVMRAMAMPAPHSPAMPAYGAPPPPSMSAAPMREQTKVTGARAAPSAVAAPQSRSRKVGGGGFIASEAAGPTKHRDVDPIRDTFERQLASGLWEGATDDDRARLEATAAVFDRLKIAGVDATHGIYGAQVKKAIEATLAIASKLAGDAGAKAIVARALTAAFALAGKRQRASIVAALRAIDAAAADALASP